MPQTRDCDFCGDDIPPGTGTMFVRTDGTAIHYCSSKCEKNADLGREPRDLEWIQDEEAEQLRRAEEGADVGDHDEVDDEGPTSAEEQAGEAGESASGEAPESDEVADDLDEADEGVDAEAEDEATDDEESASGDEDEVEAETAQDEDEAATSDESGEDEVEEQEA